MYVALYWSLISNVSKARLKNVFTLTLNATFM